MSEDPPITIEQRTSLYRFVNRALALEQQADPMSVEDAVALKALLDSESWFGPVKTTSYAVGASPGGLVRCIMSGVQYFSTHVTVPMELTPDLADELSEKLGEAAVFARMNITFNDGDTA